MSESVAIPGRPRSIAFFRFIRQPHFLITFLLGVALFPLLFVLRLHFSMEWKPILEAYWIALPLQSFLAASAIYAIEFGPRRVLSRVAASYRAEKKRLLLLAPLVAAYFVYARWPLALAWAVLTVAALELVDRMREVKGDWSLTLQSILLPGAYLFAGLIVMFCYNDIIASVRFYEAYDATFNNMDRILLGGTTVPGLMPYMLHAIPAWIFHVAGTIYSYGLFAQTGGVFFIVAFTGGRKRGLAFAGTILMSYWLALLIYFLWPSLGPFTFYQGQFTHLQAGLATRHLQTGLLLRARAFWEHLPSARVGWDYFIAFPSMHIAIPTIVLCFMRRWRRAFAFLLGLDCLLVACIILLGWHYFVDLPAGVAVAFLAFAIVGDTNSAKEVDRRASGRIEAPAQ